MTGGVLTALDEAVDQLPDADQVVQALLFEPEEIGATDAPSPLSAAIEPRRRGPGRPKGARGRRTEAVAQWLLSQARHPVLVMMEAYGMTPAELADRIGLARGRVKGEGGEPDQWLHANDTLLEVYKLQLRMAEAAAPYVAQKLPQAVDFKGAAALHVTLSGVSVPARGGLAGAAAVAIEGEVLGVRLPKSDEASRTDG